MFGLIFSVLLYLCWMALLLLAVVVAEFALMPQGVGGGYLIEKGVQNDEAPSVSMPIGMQTVIALLFCVAVNFVVLLGIRRWLRRRLDSRRA